MKAIRQRRHAAQVSVLILLLSALASAAPYETGGKVDRYFGAYTEDIPIVVPAFHGIEPRLSVSYSSAGGTGLVGVGWSLQGLSQIEETSGNLELDGQWLVGCNVTGNPPGSPSCEGGFGQSTTLSETYIRVRRLGNNYTVWKRDGTKFDYTPTTTGLSPRKWLISSVTDTSGNVVRYTWNLATSGFNFNAPDTIVYNGTVIKFYYGPRQLSEFHAEYAPANRSSGVWETIDKELVTIDVCVGLPGRTTPCVPGVDANRARAYSLQYRTSAVTGRPLLDSIQMFGRDAVLAPTGVVLKGTVAQPMVFRWNDVSPGYRTFAIGAVADWGYDWSRGMPDYNGDGRTDYCRVMDGDPTYNLRCAISTGWGFTDTWVGFVWGTGSGSGASWVDWDGDGRSDFCRIINNAIWCAFAAGAGINDMQVGAAFAAADVGSPGMRWFVDWNGDGRGDFCREAHYDGLANELLTELRCAFSLGAAANGYREQRINALYSNSEPPVGPGGQRGLAYTRAIVDWTGDGVMDFCRVVDTGMSNELRCIVGSKGWDRSSHAGGVHQTIGTIADVGLSDAQWWADVNGDGKADYCRLVGSDVRCAMSLISSLQDVVWKRLPNPVSPQSGRFGDVNGDGKADFCYDTGGTKTCEISAGLSAAVPLRPTNFTAGSYYDKHWIVDWNGDGRPEYCMNTGSNGGGGSALTCVTRSDGVPTDLATSFSNGMGATTTVSYTTVWSAGALIPVVSTVSTIDGTTTYRYTGGQYDWYTRRFLGFSSVQVIDPCLPTEKECPFTVTTNRLDYRWPTRPREIARYGGNFNALLKKTTYIYADTTLPPYRSDLLSETTFIYEGARYSQSRIDYEYDNYGNVVTMLDAGVVDDGVSAPAALTGDDRAVATTYYPTIDYDLYILDKPAVVTGYGSLTRTPATRVTEVEYFYDNATMASTPPTRGRVTTTRQWLNTGNTYVTSLASHDGWGNVTTEIDALGNRTTYTIDPTYHVFVTTVAREAVGTPPVSQSISTPLADWDVRCGVKRKETHDQNGTYTVFVHDALCRKQTRTEYNPFGRAGMVERTTYNDIGRPPLQQIAVQQTGRGSEETYFDGLGRTTKVTREAGELLAAEYQYNTRGHVMAIMRPRFANEGQIGSFITRDIQDRETSISWPNGGVKTTSYFLRSVTTTDPGGHKTLTDYNVRGQPTMTTSVVGINAQNDIVYFAYDGAGNLSRMQQLGQNGTQWSYWSFDYDSLGRKTAQSDPDSGARRYAYDAVGNLIDEWDALGVRTHYTYDALKRRTSKTLNYCAGACASGTNITSTWVYDERRAGFYNVGRLTSMIDPSGRATYNYDAAGNLVDGGRTVDGQNYTFTKQYDAGGRLLATTYPDGSTVGTSASPLTYDRYGRLANIPGFISDAKYNAEGKMTGYQTAFSVAASFDFNTPTGFLDGYRMSGANRSTLDGTMILGPFATSGTADASTNYEALPIDTQLLTLAAGMTITATTCGAATARWQSGPAEGTGDTYLRLYTSTGVELASNDNAGGPCGQLSTLSYTLAAGGQYLVRAGCAGVGACHGTVAVKIENPLINLALRKPASQTSTGPWNCNGLPGPERAVDGNRDGNFWNCSVTHTDAAVRPYWSVDIGMGPTGPYVIERIDIYNRTDGVSGEAQRLSDFEVSVWTFGAFDSTSYQVAGVCGSPTSINVGREGTNVMVRLPDTGPNYLHIAEVEVYGRVPIILATRANLHKVTVHRDLDGRIDRIASNRPNESWTFGYSTAPAHQLTQATNINDPAASETFAYDSNGNMLRGPRGSYNYPAGVNPVRPHAVTSTNTAAYIYDGNGQQVAEAKYAGCYVDGPTRMLPTVLATSGATVESCVAAGRAAGARYIGLQDGGACFAGENPGKPASSPKECRTSCTANSNQTCGGTSRNSVWDVQATTYTWDAAGRLAGVNGTLAYTYDGEGYRLKKTAAGMTTVYLSDDYEITNGVHTKYITVGGRLVAKQTGTAKTWLFTNHQGSVVHEIADGGSETPTMAASYRPYGSEIAGGAAGARGYTGQRRDESGLLYLHARFGNPALARFISPDPTLPSLESPGLNRYAYALNDPINLTDVDGLGPWEDFVGGVTYGAGLTAQAVRHADLENLVNLVGQGINEIFRLLGVDARVGRAELGELNLGIGNTLALLPTSINAAGRADWETFGKSVASEVVVSAAITVSIVSYGTAAAPIVAATNSLLVPFATTAIWTGDLALAGKSAAIGAVGSVFTSVFSRAPNAPGLGSIDYAPVTGPGFRSAVGGAFAGALSANSHIVVQSQESTAGTSPGSRMSSASGALFGYGYDEWRADPRTPRRGR